MYDVIIIGAGVTGAFIARQLSRYELNVCLLDKQSDVAMGTSKANSAIVHSGFDAVPNTLKAILNVRGNKLFSSVVQELNVSFQKIGSLVLCFQNSDIPFLEELAQRGKENGVDGLNIVCGDKLREMEPNISSHAVAALYAPSAGIVCPYELTLHAAENAVQNGVELKLDCEVTSIRHENQHFILTTPKGVLETRYLVNAAGVHADKISQLAGDQSFSIHPRKGEYVLLDKQYGSTVNHVIFQLPSEKSKGVLVTPTVDGNLLVGPNAKEIPDREDISTTTEGLQEIITTARKSIPSLDLRGIITSFAGLRAGTDEGDFIIRPSALYSSFIQAAGIESPGLTAAPAIGEMIVQLLEGQGLRLIRKREYNPYLKPVQTTRHMNAEQWNALIQSNPEFGRIVCRCEKITEGDILASIHRTIGATSLDAVKRRTRAGMGRCQGGFCSPRIVEILSRELKLPAEEITKSGGNSRILSGKTKTAKKRDK
ncbi:MAG: NAD(P)/FAD-dependent oxidoreductase [Thermoclostridium sp.]|nr:NAD(P)/FAD-dependent oxidoreductase [Thermoclostridium sp.]